MSNVSSLGSPNNRVKTVINATGTAYPAINNILGDGTSAYAFTAGFTIKKGSPVAALPERTDGASVIPFFNGAFFEGVLKKDLTSDLLGDQTAICECEGLVKANILVTTASNFTKGVNLIPMGVDTNGYGYFTYTTVSTPFRLAEDLTTRTDNTYGKVDVGTGALIEILPQGGSFAVHYAGETADVDYFKANHSATSGVATTVTLTNQFPPSNIPVNVSLTGDDANTGTFVATVSGYNVRGDAITEALTVPNSTSTVLGAKVFARVTGIAVAAPDATTVIDFGHGAKYQLPFTFSGRPALVEAAADNTVEGTAPTLTLDKDDIESNGITFNTAPDGSKILQARFVH